MRARALVLALLVAAVATNAAAAPPALIHYQGLALDSAGAAVSGSIDVTVRLYAVPTAGSAVWTESHAEVPTQDGVFSLLLGSAVPLEPALFAAHAGLWLEVEIEGEILAPRQRLASAPYALQAGCNPGDMVDCWEGDPALLGVGACSAGRRRCGADGTWGACLGGTLPAAELCDDALDNDCDGSIDCADPSCAAAPVCTAECLDDGGCPGDAVSGCGACGGFSSACDESGVRPCTCTSYACVAGACEETSTSCAQTCTRSTQGNACGAGAICCDEICWAGGACP